jgi:hypothetical protein
VMVVTSEVADSFQNVNETFLTIGSVVSGEKKVKLV